MEYDSDSDERWEVNDKQGIEGGDGEDATDYKGW